MQTGNNKITMICTKPAVLCIICLITLLFGLWPLNFHSENNIHFLQPQNGIQLHNPNNPRSYKRAIAYTTDQIKIPAQSSSYTPITIEIVVESKQEPPTGLGHIFSFYDQQSQEPLIIAQWRAHLVIRSRAKQKDNKYQYREIGLNNALPQNTKNIITIASGKDATEIFINGNSVHSFKRTSFIDPSNINGQLLIGNSATGMHPWIGNLYGLAIYDRKLSTQQIWQNYKNWNQPENSNLQPKNKPLVMYTFEKQNNNQIRNLTNNKNHIIIPPTFTPLKRNALTPFWNDFEFNRGQITDVVINVFGFIPFALCMAIYLIKKNLPPRSAYTIAIMSGTCLSLIIEITQIYLPTRHSSSLDLICNTAGTIMTIIAIMIFRTNKTK